MNIRISSDERFYLLEWGLLAAGAAAGLALAWLLIGLDWSFPSELERARAAGIVSVTTLSGYAKSRDLVAYVMTLGLPAAGALLFWLFGRGASDLGKYTLAGRFPAPTLAVWIIAGLCPFLAGFIAWHLSYMFVPKWNPYVGAWPFLGEQGATLAWVQSIWSGGVYGRDFFCLYGPMFIYPLAWLMDGFGQNVLMDGVYKLALDIAACGLLGFMLARMLRARSLALLFVLMVCMFFPTQLMSSANTTLLRTVLAMVPIACIALWVDTRRKAYFIAGSLLLGQSLLFSQEAGFCAVLAIAVMLVADTLWRGKGILPVLKVIAVFCAIVALSLAPMVGFLVFKGAGPGLLDCVFGYPQTVMLGFGGLPFPSLRDWLGGYFRENWLHFAVISIYGATLVALCVAWFRGIRSARLLWALGLLIFGILLFRVALGRSGTYATMKVMMPAIMLSALWIDELWASWRNNAAINAHKVMTAVALTVVLINFSSGMCLDPVMRSNFAAACQQAFLLEGKFTKLPLWGVAIPEIPRVGVFVDEWTATSLREIKPFLDAHTRPRQEVYFFPNEAVYYFLFDRTNPTRYPVAYFAATYDRQREVIRDLERSRPRFVIYSKKTWLIDQIPEDVQIPLITAYLKNRYRTVRKMETIDILERITAG